MLSWVFIGFETLKNSLKNRLTREKERNTHTHTQLSWRYTSGEYLIKINRELNEGKDYGKKKIFQSVQNKKEMQYFITVFPLILMLAVIPEPKMFFQDFMPFSYSRTQVIALCLCKRMGVNSIWSYHSAVKLAFCFLAPQSCV